MAQQLPSLGGKSNERKGLSGAYFRYRIEDRSYIPIIKRTLSKEAHTLGFSANKIGKLEIVVAELVSNLIKFGHRNRELLWKSLWYKQMAVIEILSLDKGPGIGSVGQALEDGFSTSGTAGEGLGAIKRLSDFFELYSQRGKGSVVLCRFFAPGASIEASHENAREPADENATKPGNDSSHQSDEDSTRNSAPEAFPNSFTKRHVGQSFGQFHCASLSVAKPMETICGDGHFVEYAPEKQQFNGLILDGLGHGNEAHEAAQAAIETYKTLYRKPLPANAPANSLAQQLREIHKHIKKTRGAAALAFNYLFKEQTLIYCGVGNIVGKTLNLHSAKNLTMFNGIVGHVMPSKLHDREISWNQESFLMIHSDGLSSRWDLTSYFQINKYDPAILAACLYRDFNRGNDDTTILICKHPETDGKN